MNKFMNIATGLLTRPSLCRWAVYRRGLVTLLALFSSSVSILLAQNFSDDFTRSTNSASVLPWQVQAGNWVITNGLFQAGPNVSDSYGFAYITNSLTNFSVSADFSAVSNAFGYGLGARVNPASGAHYAAWIYPENSPFTPGLIRLIKFPDWGVNSFTILGSTSIGSLGTNVHSITMVLDTNLINVYLDGALQISLTDNSSPYLSGGVSLDMYTYATDVYTMRVDNVTATQINYLPNVTNDFFTIRGDLSQSVAAPGVLYNDLDPDGTNLTAILETPPANGILNLSSNGGFTYLRTNSAASYDSFKYRASDGVSTSAVATVLLSLTEGAGAFFTDDFTRSTNPASLLPWTAHSGTWAVTNSILEGGTNLHSTYGSVYHTANWTNYAVEGSFLFPSNGYGGGIAGRVDSATGKRYVAWLYPELSDRGPNNIRIAKFQTWNAYGLFSLSNAQALATISLSGATVTNTWHTMKLAFSGSVLSIYYDGLWMTNVIDLDTYTNAYTSGGVGVDFFSYTNEYIFHADNVSARPLVADDNYFTSEDTQLTVTGNGVLTNDTSSIGLPLSAKLIANPAKGTVSFSTNGSFTYSPALNFVGTDSFVYEAWQETNSLGAAIVNITVESVNDAPSLAVQPDYFVAAGDSISITNTASDPDVPADILTYQLVGAPAGMTISTNGVISWTPSLAQSPSSNFITTVVTDNGSPALSDTNFISLIVTNPPGTYTLANFFENFDAVTSPGLPAGWTTTQSGGQQIWFTQTSTRDSVPNAVFASEGATSGISELLSPAISLGSGNFQLHFRNSYDLEVHPSVDGLAFDGAILEIKIGAGAFTDVIAAGGTFLSGGYTHTISPDFGNPLGGRAAWSGNSAGFITTVLALPSSVAGQTIQFRWRCSTDSATGGNGWAVDDVGVSNTLCCNFFAPVLPAQNNISINELAALTVTNTATDGDLPSDQLTYSLTTFPGGAVITTNGVISWTPSEAQGPMLATFSTVVTDKGGLAATNSFTVTVNEVNVAPVFVATPANTNLNEGVTLVVTNAAADVDVPVQGLTYTLVSAPGGAVITTNGVISWTPGEAQGPSTNTIATAVSDGVVSVTNSFVVTVNEVNVAPSFVATPADAVVNEGSLFSVTNAAADVDVPVQGLTYTLVSAPGGAVITTNGVISWTPGEAQGPSTNTIATAVSDGVVSVTNSFVVTVNEVNVAPSFVATPADAVVNEGSLFSVTNAATDVDVPVQALTYTLVSAPGGAVITTNGVISWTPGEAQGPSTNTIATAVSDGVVSVTNSFVVTVNEVNVAPSFVATPADAVVNEGSLFSVTNAAADVDVPVQGLTYTLVSAPGGAVITTNGVISWTPGEAQGPSTNTIATAVSDGVVSVTNSFVVTVNEVNVAPSFVATPADAVVNEGSLFSVTNAAADVDVPVQGLTYTLVSAPGGAVITTNGVISWTPGEAQGPSTNTIATAVSDGVVSVTNSFVVTVNEVNVAPSFVATPADAVVNEGSLFSVTNAATDVDVPVQGLTYTLVSAPGGAVITTNGVISWTPGEAQGPSTNTIATAVSDGVVSVTNSFVVTVNEVNVAPSFVATPADAVVNEGSLFSVTNAATDVDVPVQALTYTLVSAPGGAVITTNGVISWTPGEAQGPSTNTIATAVSDGVVSVTNSFVVTVNEVNVAPSFVATPADAVVNEGSLFSVTNAAADVDVPVQGLTYTLVSAPGGAVITTNGVISWTPGEAQGPSTNTIATAVSDGVVSVTNSFVVTVNEVNVAPSFVATPADAVVNEGSLFSVTNAATDVDVPVQGLTYTLVSAPGGAVITTNGVISWTPGEAQGPSTNTIATAVSDGVVSVTNSFVVTVNEVNVAPSFVATPADAVVNEGSLFSVTNAATDVDVPVQGLTYTLVSAPGGAVITTNGVISWTPGEAQGPSTNTIATAVSDGVVSVTNSFVVTVNEVNVAPSFVATPANTNLNEGVTLVVTNAATDVDVPVQALTYTLVSAPGGAVITTNGVISWTPGEAQGPSTNTIATAVSDGVVSVTNSFVVTVNEVNVAPSFVATPADAVVNEGSLFSVTNAATDVDVPVQALTYTLVSAPGGAVITTNGVISWTPGEAQGPSTNTIATAVSDGVVSVTNSFVVTVNEVNVAPSFVATPADAVVNEGSLFSVTNAATDVDVPVQGLTYTLVSAPGGAVITTNGVISWTPGEAQGPSTNTIATAVSDGVVSVTNSFVVTVNEVNVAPSFVATPADAVVNEGSLFSVTNAAADVDVPVQGLTYTLVSAPGGAVITTNGVISWTPGEAQGPSTNTIATAVSDGVVSVTNSFVVTVNEVNVAPSFVATPADAVVNEGSLFSVTNAATDVDVPVQGLTYTLVSAPGGAVITTNGVISWTPGEAQGPSTNTIATAVSDGVVSVTNSFVVTVNEVNVAPSFVATPANTNLNEGVTLVVTNAATDVDVPVQALTYTLVSAPGGAVITTNGVISWTPGEAQGPSTNTIATAVSDGVVSVTNSFVVTVNEVNVAPSFVATPADAVVNEGSLFSVTNAATDVDVPVQGLTYTLVSAPGGAVITTNGVISWTPGEAQGPSTNTIATAVSDGVVSVTNSFVVTVNEVNVAPVLPIQTNLTIAELSLLTVTNKATDGDIPVQTLSYTLLNSPTNASITTNGIIIWSPNEVQGPSTNVFTTRVTDGIASSTNSFVVFVTEVNVAPTATNDSYLVTNAVLTVAAPGVLANDSDTDLPANALTAVLVSGPTNGVLNLNSNGGFVYTPNPGFSGVDGFTYRAHDGITNYATASVSITVSNRAFVITSVTVNAGLATVTWNSTPGLYYRVQYLDNLNATNWTDLNPVVTATNISASLTNFVGATPQRFYRVKLTDAPQPVILSLQVTNGNAIITWSSVVARDYRLEYKTNLTDVVWTEATPSITANAATTTATNAVGAAAQRFFRVHMLP